MIKSCSPESDRTRQKNLVEREDRGLSIEDSSPNLIATSEASSHLLNSFSSSFRPSIIGAGTASKFDHVWLAWRVLYDT